MVVKEKKPTKEKATLSLDPQTKRDGIAILDEIGLNLSTFVEMSLRQTIHEGGLPFKPTVGRARHGINWDYSGIQQPEVRNGAVMAPRDEYDPEEDVYNVQ